jgi:hypothetical protein
MQDEQHEIGSNRIYARKAGELLHIDKGGWEPVILPLHQLPE